MNVQLSDAGAALIQASTGPITLTSFKLGDAFGYIPSPTDTDIRGQLVFQGAPSEPVASNANIVKYSVFLDYNVGDFQFGEFALMVGTTLFANGTASELIDKLAVGLTVGNSIRIDIYLSMVGTNYFMWFDLAESNNQFRVASLDSPDRLPPAAQATPNMYIIAGASSQQSPLLAYTNRDGLWAFSVYQYSTILSATVVGFDSQSITIAISDFSPNMVPQYFGQLIIQFITGQLYSICRYIKTTVVSGSIATLSFDTPLAITPIVGDKFQMYTRSEVSIDLQIPIATASVLGGIKIGLGLQITGDGVCSIDPHALGLVTSVNNQVGDVVINAGNLPGLAPVAISGSYNDLTNKPAAYALPAMSLSVRGGAKLPTNGNLVITAPDVLDLGFNPVKTVNSIGPDGSGNVNLAAAVIGLVNPTTIPNGADLNAYKTAGLFTITAAVSSTLLNPPSVVGSDTTLEVVPLNTSGTGDSVQRWTTASDIYWRKSTGVSWSAWQHVASGNIASASTLGLIKVGSGLAIAGDGTLSATYTLPTASVSTLGGIKIGSGLSVAGDGTVSTSYILPVATSTILGGVKVGAGLTIAGDGTLSWNASTALPIATASVLGGVKIGAGLSVAADGTLSWSALSLPVATTSVLGVIKVGNGLSVTGAGLITSNILTVNGASPDGSGNVAVTVPPDASKLDRVDGVATGIRFSIISLGSIGSTVTVTQSSGNIQNATFTGGAVSWTLNGWPASGTYAEVQMKLTNGGLATHTFPTAVKWVNPDGSLTPSLNAYLTNQRGTTNFQTSGVDFVVFWSDDGGATIYGKIL
jgi:hypothetical protein